MEFSTSLRCKLQPWCFYWTVGVLLCSWGGGVMALKTFGRRSNFLDRNISLYLLTHMELCSCRTMIERVECPYLLESYVESTVQGWSHTDTPSEPSPRAGRAPEGRWHQAADSWSRAAQSSGGTRQSQGLCGNKIISWGTTSFSKRSTPHSFLPGIKSSSNLKKK